MKKIVSMAIAATVLIICACNAPVEPAAAETKNPDEQTSKNIAAVEATNKAFETGDFSAIRAFLADDAVDHGTMDGKPIKGADSIIAYMQSMQKMMTGMKTNTIKILADKEYVFQWIKVSGTMTEDAMGMKKGDPIDGSSIEVARFDANGKMAEHWTFMDYADMVKMMGSMPGAQ